MQTCLEECKKNEKCLYLTFDKSSDVGQCSTFGFGAIPYPTKDYYTSATRYCDAKVPKCVEFYKQFIEVTLNGL